MKTACDKLRLMLILFALCTLDFACNLNSESFSYLNPGANSGGPSPPATSVWAEMTGDSSNLMHCSIRDGALRACSSSNNGAPGGWTPNGIAINTTNGITSAYVPSTDGHVYQCAVDSTAGTLSSCVASDGNISSWTPYLISFQTINSINYAYVGASDSSYNYQIYQCTLDSTSGALVNCTVGNTGLSSWSASSMVFSTVSGATFLSIFDSNENIDQCPLDSTTGAVGVCSVNSVMSLIGVYAESQISVNTDTNNKTWLYLLSAIQGDGTGGNISQCEISSTGTLSNCATTQTSMSWGFPDLGPETLNFATVNGVNYAYVDTEGGYYQCTVGGGGSIGSCNSMTSGIPNPIFNSSEGSLYAYGVLNNTIFLCPLNATSGNFNSCSNQLAFPWQGVNQASANSVAVLEVNGTSYAYVGAGYPIPGGDPGSSASLYQCTINFSTGSIGSCVVSNLGASFTSIISTTFNTNASGVTSAYIIAQNAQNQYLLYQCSVSSSTGVLSACTSQAPGVSPELLYFNTVGSSTYAYLFNGSHLYTCTVDATSGAISACVLSDGGVTYGYPRMSMAFDSSTGTPYAYLISFGGFVGSGSSTVYQCSMNSSTGVFTTCTPLTLSNVGFAGSLAFNASGGVTSAYIIDEYGTSPYQCPVNSATGALSACSSITPSSYISYSNYSTSSISLAPSSIAP